MTAQEAIAYVRVNDKYSADAEMVLAAFRALYGREPNFDERPAIWSLCCTAVVPDEERGEEGGEA